MARSIDEITVAITTSLESKYTLSTSAAAEWRLWVHCIAYCIHLFELALDIFMIEMDADAEKEVAGSVTWYNQKCYEFQLGHELVFNKTTGLLRYAQIDESAQVIKIASVNADDNTIYFRVATRSEDGEIIPLTDIELLNFKNYIDAVKFAGTKSQVISTDADLVRYGLTIYYNPASPISAVEESVLAALDEFKTSQKFGGVVYSHKLIEAVTAVSGVVAAKLTNFESKSADADAYTDIDTLVYLHAGYFNYAEDSTITFTSINDI